MTEIIKKYLVTKWWIPIWFFGISIILFMSGTILPDSDLGFYILIFFSIILLISSIWQLLKGKAKIGFFQLSILAIPFIFFAFIAYLFAGITNKPNEKLALENIELLIQDKTDLIIPKNFEVLKNLIEHTDGAFDSDYSISLSIKFEESDEKNILEQINKSAEIKSNKGLWKKYKNGFEFEHNNNEINSAEPFYCTVDTLNNNIKLILNHL
jgi:hypothetical protein